MRNIICTLLALAALLPATAYSATNTYLFQADPGSYAMITAVYLAANGGGQEKACLRFGSDGGRVDLAAGVVHGRAEDGTDIVVPLAEVAKVTARFDRAGRVRDYVLLVDALRDGTVWPPPGRITSVVLVSGVTIDFELVAPGLDREERFLFWSHKGTAQTRVPFGAIAIVQIKTNSFVRDLNDMADICVVSEVELISGEVLDTIGRGGVLDSSAEVIRYGAENVVPLDGVRRIAVCDSRSASREFVPEVPAASPPVVREEGFDLGGVNLCGERVRLRGDVGDRTWVEGRVLTQDSLGLALLVESDTLSVSLGGLGELLVSQGRGGNSKKGALIGGGIVGAVGLGVGLAFANDGSFDTPGWGVVTGTFLGFTAGALVGGVVGSFFNSEKWENVERVKIEVVTTGYHAPGLAITRRF